METQTIRGRILANTILVSVLLLILGAVTFGQLDVVGRVGLLAILVLHIIASAVVAGQTGDSGHVESADAAGPAVDRPQNAAVVGGLGEKVRAMRLQNGLDERRFEKLLAAMEPNAASEAKESKTPADMGRAIKAVGDIVEQAKLLAANTTIEAARMGEAGLGMSRLAAEMKKLAEELAHEAGVIQTKHSETGSEGVDVAGGFGTVRTMVEDLQKSQQKMAEMLSAHGSFIEAWEKDLLTDEA